MECVCVDAVVYAMWRVRCEGGSNGGERVVAARNAFRVALFCSVNSEVVCTRGVYARKEGR